MSKKRKVADQTPLVGAHMSIAGGVWRAFGRLAEVGGNALQVFLKSNVQWRFGKLTDELVAKFDEARAETGIKTVLAHACYLVNLASPDREVFKKSFDDLVREVEYAARYGIPWLILHPGNHMESGVERGIESVASALKKTLSKPQGPGILIETTAGSGTALGSTFEEIAEIIDRAGGDGRLGMCLDTSHVFAAGYDIAGDKGYREVKKTLRSLGLLKRIKAIHVNDSKVPLGSRVDRHEHIGKGKIGRKAFARIMQDRDFAEVPKILETPKGMYGSGKCDRMNISLLKRLARA